MKHLVKGITFAFKRNIGWQDRTIRSIAGVAAVFGAIYFYPTNLLVSALCWIFFAAQAWTVLLARCIICYFAGVCTIGAPERGKLARDGVAIEG